MHGYRWEIINHFIQKNNYKSFLEIGYYKAWNFDSVNCEEKTAVDPNPCKTPDMESAKDKAVIMQDGKYLIHKLTSDEFFSDLSQSVKYDIIFIDGLHEAKQVTRDIENSLKHLSEGGVILLHDCNPPTYEHTTTGDCGGNWNGDVYKAFIEARAKFPYETYTVDTDWGVGVIKPYEKAEPLHKLVFEKTRDYWPEFDEHRVELLNLISIPEFLEKEKINEGA